MNENTLAHLVKPAHILTDHEHLFVIGASQVLPVPVKSRDSMRLESFRIVRKADCVIDAIRADSMLTGLLQVNNYADVEVQHLRDHVILLNLASARPLRTDYLILN